MSLLAGVTVDVYLDNLVVNGNTLLDDDTGTIEVLSGTIDGTPWVTSIQVGIDAALPSDTINVAAGTYNEAILIDKPLTLRGATADVNKNGYTVPANYAWDDSVESIIQPPAGSPDADVIKINDASDLTIEGFVLQALHRTKTGGNADNNIIHVDVPTQIDNLTITNNVIGANMNVDEPLSNKGRHGLRLETFTDGTGNGVTNSLIAGNKIIDCKGNGNNVFIWGSKKAGSPGGAAGPSPMAGTVIEDNEICGGHRSGIEIAGGITGLTIRNNSIHDQSGFDSDESTGLKYGNGILLCRDYDDVANAGCAAFGPEDLTIENNEIYNNEKNGIYTGPINKDYTISGNDIHDNGWDAIRIDLEGSYHDSPCYDKTSNIAANFNNILGNAGYGAQVLGIPTNGFTLDATNNWWGAADGPSLSPGSGDKVSDNVDYDPWLGAPLELPAVHHETLGAGDHEVDASDEADTTVTLTTTGDTEIYVTRYESQPFPGEEFPDEALGKYIDIHVSNPENVTWPIHVEVSYTDDEVADAGIDESTLGLYYYELVDTFHRCSDTGVNMAEKFIWADVTAEEASGLAGTGFGAGGSPPPPVGVGGEAYPVNKLGILAPWISLAIAILAGSGAFMLLRRKRTAR